MNTADLIRANLASVREQLAETFPHITDELLSFAPGAGMPSLKRVLMDIGTTETVFIERILGLPDSPDEVLDAPYERETTTAGVVRLLQNARQETLRVLDGLDEQSLEAPAKISKRSERRLHLSPAPVAEVFRYIVRHETYHTGQVVSYLWASGNDPGLWDE